MESSNEEEYAAYFYELFAGHLGVAQGVDPLLAHVVLRRLIDHGINMTLDRWSEEDGANDE